MTISNNHQLSIINR